MLEVEQKDTLGEIVYPAESLRQRFQRSKPKVVRNVPPTDHPTCAVSDLERLIQSGKQTGAGTATVTRAIAEKHNETAAEGDKVTPEALNQRVRRNEGIDDDKITKRKNNPPRPLVHPTPNTQSRVKIVS